MSVETAFDETRTEPVVKPRFCALKLDETSGWAPDIAERAKRILGVYVFDANLRVHCCEFTPSYECYFVESQFDNPDLPDREADWLSVDLMQGDCASDPLRYFHCYQIDGLPRIKEGQLAVGVIELGIDNEEEAFDYVQLRAV